MELLLLWYINDGFAKDAGHVRIYDWDNSNMKISWIQRGNDIDGEAADDNSGRSVSLSSDGLTVAIGAWKNMVLLKMLVMSEYMLGTGCLGKICDIDGE